MLKGLILYILCLSVVLPGGVVLAQEKSCENEFKLAFIKDEYIHAAEGEKYARTNRGWKEINKYFGLDLPALTFGPTLWEAHYV